MLRLARWDFQKNRAGTRYAELVFLHPVGYAGYVVHSGASRACNVDALFVMLGQDWYDSTKSALGYVTPNMCFCILWDLRSCIAFWCIWGVKRRRTNFHAQVVPVWFP
jgi:hypothetical protein